MGPGAAIVLIRWRLCNAGRNPAYESSKAAQIALARAIAVAGERRARCNALCPGRSTLPGRDDPAPAEQRAGRAFGRQGRREVAYACLFLISNESSYVNASAMMIDGGLSVPPHSKSLSSRTAKANAASEAAASYDVSAA